MSSRVRTDGELTRARICAAGLHLVIDRDWQAVTFRDIAGRLTDVSWQTVKHHFKTLAELHRAVLDHARQVAENKACEKGLRAQAKKAVEAAAALQIA